MKTTGPRSRPAVARGRSPSQKVLRREPRRMLMGTTTPSIVTSAQQLFAQLQSSLQVTRIYEADDGGRVQLIDAAVSDMPKK